jgi:hypothetical protein
VGTECTCAVELNLKLEDLATTTSATSTDQSSFTTRFFASLFARLTQWFADATNDNPPVQELPMPANGTDSRLNPRLHCANHTDE